ncbi:hypothetical protein BDP55DRAFT_639355 [Colletotrichum godetiae]|uniref:BZIP domain-containing protein n=1 Tax=Colletotrichum godetiae TaxID=1209918 RepID=A0AAJ0ELV3_9PEZI|nr:uncharacterized protein BDP55DRAFT_639355 [Colletotrichum godetiae]KAK1656746.1 hypothetical protein BDP55DRAFT_639355 [Colletotrichum godetiae]
MTRVSPEMRKKRNRDAQAKHRKKKQEEAERLQSEVEHLQRKMREVREATASNDMQRLKYIVLGETRPSTPQPDASAIVELGTPITDTGYIESSDPFPMPSTTPYSDCSTLDCTLLPPGYNLYPDTVFQTPFTGGYSQMLPWNLIPSVPALPSIEMPGLLDMSSWLDPQLLIS